MKPDMDKKRFDDFVKRHDASFMDVAKQLARKLSQTLDEVRRTSTGADIEDEYEPEDLRQKYDSDDDA